MCVSEQLVFISEQFLDICRWNKLSVSGTGSRGLNDPN